MNNNSVGFPTNKFYHKILSDKQYGFRKDYSTDIALLHMINDITEGLDNKFFLYRNIY